MDRARNAIAGAAMLSSLLAQAAPASAEVCPGLSAASLALHDARVALWREQTALSQAEGAGPGTLADQDRLSDLRTKRPGEIAAELSQFKQDLSAKRSRTLAERDRRIADLTRQRDQLAARNEADLTAQQNKYNDLVANGAQTANLDSQIRDAKNQENNLRAEKQRVLADLNTGRFCSKCDKSAYEIEQGGTTFQAHLTSVNGVAVMRPEKIQARSDDYDRQIAQAGARRQQLERQLQDLRSQHDKSVRDTLAAITRLRTEGAASVASLGQQVADQTSGRASDVVTLDAELRTGEARFAEMETQRAAEETALAQSIDERTAEYTREVTALRDSLAAAETKIGPLQNALENVAASCRSSVSTTQESGVIRDTSRRQEIGRTQQVYQSASYEDARAREIARRAALDAGQPPPAPPPSTRLASLERSVRDAYGTVKEKVAGARKSWREGLGLRETGFYTSLPPDVRTRIDKNIETFTSGRNTVRAVIKDSLGRLRSGSTMAVMRNAIGGGNGLSPDLAAAVDNAAPSMTGTLKRNLMPTIEAIAVETAVDSRERMSGHTFDRVERLAERGYVQTMAFILDRKKTGEALIQNVEQQLDIFMISLTGKDDNE